jgi:hypothetical protein
MVARLPDFTVTPRLLVRRRGTKMEQVKKIIIDVVFRFFRVMVREPWEM